MFSNLLAELDSTIKSAKKSMKEVISTIPASAMFDSHVSEVPKDYDPRLKSGTSYFNIGVAPSFPKSNRFKDSEK